MESAALIKLGNYENISSLRDKGEIHMNTLPYFREIEDDELRGDPFDSVSEIHRGTKGHIVIPNTGKKIQVTNFELRIGPDNPEKFNLYCMYALRARQESYPIDEKNYRFGTHALIIFNAQTFMDKLKAELKDKNINGSSNLVEYIDNDHTGKVGPFKKLNRFSYQSEWRLLCKNGDGNPRKVIIGPINDISLLVETQNINNEVMVTYSSK